MQRYQRAGLTVAPRPNDFSAAMREASRRILVSANGLTPAERQLLHDTQRRDGRSYFATMAAILTLSARCACPSVRFHAVEACRGQVLANAPVPMLSVPDAFDRETEWQSTGDRAQLRHADQRALETNAHAIEALTGHYESLRRALDALARERATFAEWR